MDTHTQRITNKQGISGHSNPVFAVCDLSWRLNKIPLPRAQNRINTHVEEKTMIKRTYFNFQS